MITQADKQELSAHALLKAIETNDLTEVRRLLNSGVDANTYFSSNHRQMVEPALSVAARHGNAQIVQLLLDKGADIRMTDNHGVTPLRAAQKAGQMDVVLKLRAAGANK
jgi:hypothetical protein